jgi:hypothetical protein
LFVKSPAPSVIRSPPPRADASAVEALINERQEGR